MLNTYSSSKKQNMKDLIIYLLYNYIVVPIIFLSSLHCSYFTIHYERIQYNAHITYWYFYYIAVMIKLYIFCYEKDNYIAYNYTLRFCSHNIVWQSVKDFRTIKCILFILFSKISARTHTQRNAEDRNY